MPQPLQYCGLPLLRRSPEMNLGAASAATPARAKVLPAGQHTPDNIGLLSRVPQSSPTYQGITSQQRHESGPFVQMHMQVYPEF